MSLPAEARRIRLRRALAGALALPFLLAACSGDDVPPPCPEAVRVVDASRLVKFEGPGRDLTDVRFEAELQSVQLACEHDDGVVESTLGVTFQVLRGPADRERLAPLKYFVAIATRDKVVVAREEFDLGIPFKGNRTRVRVFEELTPRIPLKPDESGADYRIYVGFSLTREEMRYNRQNR